MSTSLREQLDRVHPQMLRKDLDPDPKKLAEHMKAQIGQAVERAIARSGATKQEVAFAMGYSDPGTVSRWCAGTETPQFAKLFAVASLQQPLVIELAGLAGEGIEITTHITVRERTERTA